MYEKMHYMYYYYYYFLKNIWASSKTLSSNSITLKMQRGKVKVHLLGRQQMRWTSLTRGE